MKKILLACAAAAVWAMPAPAQSMPKLSDFLAGCYRDSGACRVKLKDYIVAGETQKILCRPKDVSVSEAVSDMLRWLRSDETHPASLNDQPFDDGLYEAAIKLFPCQQEAAPPPPPPPAEPAAPSEPAAPVEPPAPAQ